MKKQKKGKGIKTGRLSERKPSEQSIPKPQMIVSVTCQFCAHRAELQITSPQREGSTLLCNGHVGAFFSVWTGKATEFTVVKL